MNHVTGTLISYYFYCKRRLWLHANEIRLEDNSEDVGEGRLIEDVSYPERSERFEQIQIENIKIDYYDAHNKVIHEIKKSNKFHETHIWQIKYYIYVLMQNEINGVTGILEYPQIRKVEKVFLSSRDVTELDEITNSIVNIIKGSCPIIEKTHKCKNCSYYDFCWINEEPDSK